ncbi:MAG: MucR family transcriptional regulator [Deferrisomatales bacterium]|nr:MucR family transcriptional regulator [Deferrisomatales bacterium]
MDKSALLTLTTDIVSAHASVNGLSVEELLSEIQDVYAKLSGLAGHGGEECIAVWSEEVGEDEAPATPAVPLNAAFGSEKIFCMVCGKGFTTLKRHLTVSHDLTAQEYRKKFGIPAGTVLASKNYSESRRQMAKDMNLADGLAKARAARGKKK